MFSAVQAKVFTKSFDDPNVVSLRRRIDETLHKVEETEEATRTVA